MRKSNNIVWSVLCILYSVLFMTACGTTSTAPLDDAYYWPDKKTQNIHSTQITPNTQSSSASPAIEIINSQDTTVTIRVKK